MLAELLLPDPDLFHIHEVCIVSNSLVQLSVSTAMISGRCPICQTDSYRVHSRTVRMLSDLPCVGREMQMYWQVRRFFCDNQECSRLTFTEQLPDIAHRYAHRTRRLKSKQCYLGYELGGEAGRRLATLFSVPISSDQLLRWVGSIPEAMYKTPRVLGVDDWAMRKRHTYGTILVDLEKRQVVDLLPDRKPETLLAWLQVHPGVEILCRDRGQEYIEGARQGAPNAIQIADRFHLLSNLLEVMENLFKHNPNELHQAEKRCVQAVNGEAAPDDIHPGQTAQEKGSLKTYTQARFEKVKALQKRGLGRREIARQTGFCRRTVGKYFLLDEPPKRAGQISSPSKVLPYLDYVRKRVNEGCCDIQVLLGELQEQGFTGSYASLWRAIHGKLGLGKLKKSSPPSRKVIKYSPRQVAWICVRPETGLKDTQKDFLKAILEGSNEIVTAIHLAQDFRVMIEQKQHENLDDWLTRAEKSRVVEFVRFAESLRADYQAVEAALSYPWSSGQVEGQVNRLKMIKREMYGRASFGLLRRRVLGPPVNA
jgi:transposase